MKTFCKLTIIFLLAITSFCFADEEILMLHNQLRSAHGAPHLIWDTKLAHYAKKHAEKCQFRHSHSPYGENLATGYPSLETAISAWYNEQKDYSYQSPKFSMRTGHFTQLIWKNSTNLGCAYIACNGKNNTPGKFLVCEYSPPGNITNSGYFKANVLPKTKTFN